jgi:hypothetical protein
MTLGRHQKFCIDANGPALHSGSARAKQAKVEAGSFIRHCEERSDDAIHACGNKAGLLRCARNDGEACHRERRKRLACQYRPVDYSKNNLFSMSCRVPSLLSSNRDHALSLTSRGVRPYRRRKRRLKYDRSPNPQSYAIVLMAR